MQASQGVQTAPAASLRGHTSGAEKRCLAFLNDLRSQLADGDWHHIRPTEIGLVHSVNHRYVNILSEMRAIEKKKLPGVGRPHAYRRTAALAHVTPETLMKCARGPYAKDEKKVATPKPAPVQLTIPTPDPAPPEATYFISNAANPTAIAGPFGAIAECEKHFLLNARPGEEWLILAPVQRIKASMTIERL